MTVSSSFDKVDCASSSGFGKRIIAIDGKLPLDVIGSHEAFAKEDMKWFRRHTLGADVVMGRNTWVSMGCKPLEGRGTHYVITSKKIDSRDEKIRFLTLDEFAAERELIDEDELWLIGGAKLYDELIGTCSAVYWNNIEVVADELNKVLSVHDATYVDLSFADGDNVEIQPLKRWDTSPNGAVAEMAMFAKIAPKNGRTFNAR